MRSEISLSRSASESESASIALLLRCTASVGKNLRRQHKKEVWHEPTAHFLHMKLLCELQRIRNRLDALENPPRECGGIDVSPLEEIVETLRMLHYRNKGAQSDQIGFQLKR